VTLILGDVISSSEERGSRSWIYWSCCSSRSAAFMAGLSWRFVRVIESGCFMNVSSRSALARCYHVTGPEGRRRWHNCLDRDGQFAETPQSVSEFRCVSSCFGGILINVASCSILGFPSLIPLRRTPASSSSSSPPSSFITLSFCRLIPRIFPAK